MGWFNVVIGVFLIASAFILHFMLEGMRRRNLMHFGIGPVDKFNNSQLRPFPLYLIAAVGVGFILYQAVVTILN